MTRKPPSNPRGRPREFNEEQALDAATRVFADKGYERASLSELARAMGINRVSMYSTFGNKEALFRKAMDRYTQASGNHLAACLSAGTAREAIENILRSGVKMHTDPKGPGACFVTQPPPTAAEATEETRRYFERKRGDVERALPRRFERAIEEGRAALLNKRRGIRTFLLPFLSKALPFRLSTGHRKPSSRVSWKSPWQAGREKNVPEQRSRNSA